MIGMDRIQELLVRARTGGIELIQLMAHLLDLSPAAIVNVLDAQSRSLCFQSLPQAIPLDDVLPRRYADPGANTGLALHESVYLQVLQRLGNGDETHADRKSTRLNSIT